MRLIGLFFIAFLVGFLITIAILGARAGEGPQLLVYRGHNHCLHIHHWILIVFLSLAFTAGIFASNGSFANERVIIIYGVALGAACEDLVYADRFTIRVPCHH